MPDLCFYNGMKRFVFLQIKRCCHTQKILLF